MLSARVRLTALTKAVKAGGKRRALASLTDSCTAARGWNAIQEEELIGCQAQEIEDQGMQLAHGFAGGLADEVIQAPPPAQDAGGQLPEQGLIGAGDIGISRQGLSDKVIQKGAGGGAGEVLALPGADNLQGQTSDIGEVRFWKAFIPLSSLVLSPHHLLKKAWTACSIRSRSTSVS